ncbi:hypothetical protein GCM10023093_07370 [Nemorincola caseinilytica]|uniref:Cytosine-specific methyltransferase n=1 Tax=Nemorincola caseinilytica TaxID=2054315 RepID=A0ABP8N5Z6_9BACT
MRHASLFSGGGGFDLAAELMGWETVLQSEIDPFCNKVLAHYWPHAENVGDIRLFDAKRYQGKIDVLTGGFPCQPFSLAGKRKGTADPRHLWPEMLRVVGEIRPRWVVGENVYGILNWNGGMVFEQVHADLEALGYEVRAFVLPACGVGAPHRRYRVWFVARNRNAAHSDAYRNGLHRGYGEDEKLAGEAGKHAQRHPQQVGRHVPDRHSEGLERRAQAGNAGSEWAKLIEQFARRCQRGYWRDWPSRSPVRRGDDGLPGRLDGITLPKWRREAIRMYGNAVVPQLALQIFKAIEAAENSG